MADGYISQIKTPDNKVYDFRDQHLKVYTGSCTTAAGTAIKDVTTDGEFTLAKGAVIFVNFSVTNSAAVANLKLRVNSSADTDAKAIKWLNNASDPANIPGVGYLRANQTYMFRYDGTNWVVDLQYDYNSNTYDRTYVNNNKKARVAITAGSICVGNSEGYAGIDNGVEFDIAYPILYQPTAMAANGVRSDFYLYSPSITSTVNTTGLTHVANGILYMTGTLSGTTFTCNSKTLTYTIPTNEDNLIYIPVAINTNATTQSFYFLGGIAHMFWYKNGAFREYSGASEYALSAPLSGISGADDLKAIEAISGTTGLLKKTAANTWTLDTNNYVTSSGITSVTIDATSPVQSSTSTAQIGSSASTTISLKDAYGDTKNPYGTKAKNLILAGPSSGSNAAPSFRALVAADIPSLAYVPATSGANDVNTLVNTGIYNITSGSLTNGPVGYGYGQLLVMSYRKHTGNTTTDWATQLYAHLGSGNNGNTLYYRTSNASTWQTWQMVAHADAATAMGDAKKPIYINAKGEIQEGTALKDLAYISKGSGTTKFLREDGTWQTALTSHQSLAAYAPLASPSLTGTPTAPTAANGTSTTQIATTEFVNNTLSYVNAMRFKGTLGTGGTVTALPASHEAGDTYRVITAGTWAGENCAVGTLIICTTDGTTANDAHWACVGTNEDGTMIGPDSSTDNAIARFDGTTGRIIQNSGVTIDDSNNLTVPGTALKVTNTSGAKYILMGNQDSSGTNKPTILEAANGSLYIGNGTNWSSSTGGTLSTAIFMSPDRKIGIGTTSPDKLLTVNGTSNFKDTMTITGASINMSKAGELGIEVDNTQATNPNKIAFIIGSSGNGGIYSRKHSKWIVYASAGGTVVLNGNANTATKLETARNLGVALGSTTAVTFDGSANQTSIPVSGTLGIANGGTGATSAADARTNLNTVTGNARVFYGTCATAAATTLKEVICAEYDKVLTIGDMLIVKFDNTNSGAVGSLQITVKNSTSDSDGTTAKNIKRQYNSTGANNLVATGELNKDSIAVFVYNGTYWILTNADYNNTYSYDWTTGAGGNGRTAETAENGGVGIHRYSLQMMTLNLTWSSLSSDHPTAATTNGGATDKTVATCSFLLDSPIIYQDTNANAIPGNSANVNGFTTGAINLQYSTTNAQWSALTIQKPVYLIGTLQSDGTFKLNATKWWTQTLPTSDDGQIYIFLGLAYSATNIYLHDAHPIYWYKNGEIQPYAGYATATSRAAITTTANAVAYYTNTTGTFGSKASANGALYATSDNGELQWGKLPIAQGGTGVTSFTKNQVILSDNTNGTTGLTSRAYSDSSSAGALSNTSTNFVTERDVYFGLPTINNAHNYASSSTYYAPTTGGTAGHVLIGAGATTAPAWYGGTVMSGTAAASWITAFNGTTDATATNAAAVTIAGGLGIGKKLCVGDTATVPDLTIGSTNEYGDAYTPIYWHEGVPTTVTLVQQCAFTIKSGMSGVKLSHAAITADSYVTQIVVTSGEANLNSAISWTSAAGYIELTCSSTVSGDVTGYIMISRGGEITATATDIT